MPSFMSEIPSTSIKGRTVVKGATGESSVVERMETSRKYTFPRRENCSYRARGKKVTGLYLVVCWEDNIQERGENN
jgi:hypothetical protein